MRGPIYLIGYMGAGKSTTGRLLADKLGWHFVDLDDAFLEIHGMTTGDYIRRYGLEEFRHKEKYVVEDLAELPIENVVYATGGGYPCWEDNMECLKELGVSFYLRWSPEHLTRRIELSGTAQRPVLGDRSGEELLAFVRQQMGERENYYAQADYVVDAPLDGRLHADNDEDLAERLYTMIRNKQ
ncbi:MAG: shikimate kinase [Paludibacteraceae bacterium]|nr:shikimate kinase [Paludibacteraceae bacterium]